MAPITPAQAAAQTRPSDRSLVRPITVISSEHAGWRLYVNEIFRYRDLVYFLVRRDVRVRYSQTVLGLGWSVLQPVLQMIVFSVFFGDLAGISSGNVPYPVFSLAAVVPWTYFNNAVGAASTSLITNGPLVSKIYFPRLLIPLAPVGAGLVDNVIAVAILFIVMGAYGIVPPLWGLPALLLLIPLLVLCTAAVSVWVAALGVQYRDVRYVTPFMLQILLFVTPIIYVVSSVPSRARVFYSINPLVGIISGFRWAMLRQGPMPVGPLLTSFVVSSMLILFGLRYFRRVERAFADIA